MVYKEDVSHVLSLSYNNQKKEEVCMDFSKIVYFTQREMQKEKVQKDQALNLISISIT